MTGHPPHDYIPPGPLETAPGGGYCGPETRREAFAAVLAGVETGAYDRLITDWLAGLDDTTCRTVASLLWRERAAGRAEAAQPPEGTVTEWGVRFTGTGLNGDPRTYFQPYPGEDSARSGAREARLSSPHITVTLMCRQTGPWTEVTESEEGNDG